MSKKVKLLVQKLGIRTLESILIIAQFCAADGIFTFFLFKSLVFEQPRRKSLAKRYEKAATRVAAIKAESTTQKASATFQ